MSTHRVSVAVHAHAWNHLPTLARAALWTPGVTWHAQAARVETEPLDADAVARVTAALDARGLRYVLIPTNARRCRFCGCVDAFACDEGCTWLKLTRCSACANRTQPLPTITLQPEALAS